MRCSTSCLRPSRSAGRTDGRLRLAARGLAVAAFALCTCALITRLVAEVWSVPAELVNERLGFPLTYWNALGLLTALGMVICFALSADTQETPIGRVLAAAALPVLATRLLLTFARGPLGAGAAGLLVAALAVRSRVLPAALLGLALVRASAGLDPEAAARRALELNPREGMVREMLARFGETEDPREWRKRALAMRLPVD